MVGSVGSPSPFASAANAMALGEARMAGAAEKIATDLDPAAIVDLALGKAQVRAGVAVARSADEMMGTLIDALA